MATDYATRSGATNGRGALLPGPWSRWLLTRNCGLARQARSSNFANPAAGELGSGRGLDNKVPGPAPCFSLFFWGGGVGFGLVKLASILSAPCTALSHVANCRRLSFQGPFYQDSHCL